MEAVEVSASPTTSMSKRQVFLMYYKDNDVFFSAEGILKLVAILVCTVVALLSASSAPCWQIGGALTSVAVPLVVAALLSLLVAARALQLPRKAPGAFILTDIVVCSVSGAASLAWAALGAATCHRYLLGILALCVSATVTASACLTYRGAMLAWEWPAGAARPSDVAAPAPRDLDA